MKKLVMVGPKTSKLIDAPIPEINDDQVLVKMHYCGVCMSEHYAWSTCENGNGIDQGMGHEPMGVVEKVGKNVTHVKPGDRVTGMFGGIAEYNVGNKNNVFLVPDNIPDEDAIGEPIACLYSAVSKVPMSMPGETSVAVVGCGYMGCGAISLLKMRGAGRIVAVDIRKECLKDALKYGADEAYLPSELPKGYLADWSNVGAPAFDYVMEWGETEESLDLAIKMTKMCGFLGIGAYHTGGKRAVDVQLLNVKAIDCLSTHPREAKLSQQGLRCALHALSTGQWNYRDLPVKIYPMNQFDKAHEELTSKYGKYMKALINCQMLDGDPYMING